MPSPVHTTTPSTDPTAWIPKGYDAWEADPNLAWKWTAEGDYTCRNGTACWSITIVSRKACGEVRGRIGVLKAENGSAFTTAKGAHSSVKALRPYQILFAPNQQLLVANTTYWADLNRLECTW